MQLRKNDKRKFEKDFLKIMSNSIYGKLLSIARKHDTKTMFVTKVSDFKKLVSEPRFREFYRVNNDAAIVRLASKSIELKYPMHIEWFILGLSKFHMYNLFYNVLKKQFGNKVRLQYMDTDSFLLNFEGEDVYKEMKTCLISEHVDFSNFPVDHELYDKTR